MRPTPRTQPYRAGMPRMLGMALDAMLTGRQPGQLNPADYDRLRQQQAVRDLAQRQLQAPEASADVRGIFANAPRAQAMPRPRMQAHGFIDPHIQRILAELLAAKSPTLVR